MNGDDYEVKVSEVIDRLSSELVSAIKRAVVAEAARDSLIEELSKLKESDDVAV